ncbi:MAG: hypothetical protein ACR2NZ_19310 [Rubripirellula sp.]
MLDTLVATLDSPELRHQPRWLRRPLWWCNLFSLDAVGVAMAWQLVFTHQYCERWPSASEFTILGLTVWIAYTADRLLDARQLNESQSHALRHRVHRDLRGPILLLWFAAILLDAVLIASVATLAQLKWGLSCLLLVLLYMARIHHRPGRAGGRGNRSRFRLPKELLAGLLFGFGISLLAWSSMSRHQPDTRLLSMAMAGLLFATNCASVAFWDRHQDRVQGFRSWIRQPSYSLSFLRLAVGCQIAATAVLYSMGYLPLLIAASLLLCDFLLLLILIANESSEDNPSLGSLVIVPPHPWALMADLSLVLPPALLVAANIALR